jgi:4-deoxy-L-threo-5-hexosulose-uronate ketol-isomerase
VIERLFEPGAATLQYLQDDRMIVGGVVPLSEPVSLDSGLDSYGSLSFPEGLFSRREMGLLNIGGPGTVAIDGKSYMLESRDALYVGRGADQVVFTSSHTEEPANYYLNCVPAHASHPTTLIGRDAALKLDLGDDARANARTIYQYIHPQLVASCQLLMGITSLKPGSVWNTMPAHTHVRRMEVYLYFDLAAEEAAFHFLGTPDQTRHIVVRDRQSVISPSWSIHSGVGTTCYSFVWGMAGDNQEFADMQSEALTVLR